MDSQAKEAYDALRKKRDQAIRQKGRYESQMRRIKAACKCDDKKIEKSVKKEQPESPAKETIFTSRIAAHEEEEKTVRADRSEVGRERGLHSVYDCVTRLDIELRVTEVRSRIETVTNLATGKSVRADGDGPKGFQVTWNALSVLVKMVVGFSIPINRVAMMLGHRKLTSGKISRLLGYVAQRLVPVYLHLSDCLANAEVLSGDDTSTKVVDTSDPGDDSELTDDLIRRIDSQLGWQADRKDGKGPKKSLHVSLLMGREIQTKPRSTICFFRTHFGQIGDLLSRVLEARSPRAGPLTFQGDLSTANLPSTTIRTAVKTILAGCGAHARRPFWRYREDDVDLCYYMLRGFALLAAIEDRITSEGGDDDTKLKLRRRYGRLIWQAMRNRCIAALTGVPPTIATMPPGHVPTLVKWPPKTALNRACAYVVDHFPELTRYLDDPRLEYTNNRRERGLRAEVCMLVSSKFRRTRRGRASLDVLRTINATCTSTGLDLTAYLRYVVDQPSELVTAHPERFTPYAVYTALTNPSDDNEITHS